MMGEAELRSAALTRDETWLRGVAGLRDLAVMEGITVMMNLIWQKVLHLLLPWHLPPKFPVDP